MIDFFLLFFFLKARSQRGVKIINIIKTRQHKPARQVLQLPPPDATVQGVKLSPLVFVFSNSLVSVKQGITPDHHGHQI